VEEFIETASEIMGIPAETMVIIIKAVMQKI